jgi:hypothetical protein
MKQTPSFARYAKKQDFVTLYLLRFRDALRYVFPEYVAIDAATRPKASLPLDANVNYLYFTLYEARAVVGNSINLGKDNAGSEPFRRCKRLG